MQVPKTSMNDIDAILIPASPRNWDTLGAQIYAIEKENFGEDSLDMEMMRTDLNDPSTSLVVLRDDKKIVGFTYAVPESEGVARIVDTVISKEYQHKGFVSFLMTRLESDLRAKGYGFVTRDSMIANGYAEKIAKHYSDRIVEMRDVESQWGTQRHFKIRI
jgi:ribosomal protein S18 acetylase RimI-like enzyme